MDAIPRTSMLEKRNKRKWERTLVVGLWVVVWGTWVTVLKGATMMFACSNIEEECLALWLSARQRSDSNQPTVEGVDLGGCTKMSHLGLMPRTPQVA